MKFYGIPDKLVRIVKLLYVTFQCAVLKDSEETDWFRVTTGVKQDCTLDGYRFHNDKNHRNRTNRNKMKLHYKT